VTPSGIDSNASSTVESTVKSARAVSQSDGPGAQVVMETRLETPRGALIQASSVSPSVIGPTSHLETPALESGPRPSAVSTQYSKS